MFLSPNQGSPPSLLLLSLRRVPSCCPQAAHVWEAGQVRYSLRTQDRAKNTAVQGGSGEWASVLKLSLGVPKLGSAQMPQEVRTRGCEMLAQGTFPFRTLSSLQYFMGVCKGTGDVSNSLFSP